MPQIICTVNAKFVTSNSPTSSSYHAISSGGMCGRHQTGSEQVANGPRRLAHPEADVIRIRIGLSVGLVPVDCLILHFPLESEGNSAIGWHFEQQCRLG